MKPLNFFQKSYNRLAVASFATVFLLILIGGTVRITGSGMGCPDWPKCFGRWVPPTHVSELPSNYQQLYAHRGYDGMEFNATKTWIEYLNRLFGALTGFIALLFAVTSLWYWKYRKSLTILAFSILLLVGFEGWLGAKVVESNLDNYKITTHLFGAMLILFLNIWAVIQVSEIKSPYIGKLKNASIKSWVLICAGIFLVVQMLLGTMVRAEVDAIADNTGEGNRASWIEGAGTYLPVHKVVSYAVILPIVYLIVQLFKQHNLSTGYLYTRSSLVIGLAGQLVTALFLDRLGYPALAQLLHLGFAILLFSALTYLIIKKFAYHKQTAGIGLKKVNYA